MSTARVTVPRRFAGVLAGAALSSIAVAASIVVTWLNRDSSEASDDAMVLVAAAASLPAFLLGATALVLLSGRTRNASIANAVAALAVFVSLVPLEIIFLREIWAVFTFSALFAALVALVLTEPSEQESRRGPQISALASQAPVNKSSESPPPMAIEDDPDPIYTFSRRGPGFWRKRFSTGDRAASKRKGWARIAPQRPKAVQNVATRHLQQEDVGHPHEPSPVMADANHAVPPSQDSGMNLSAILNAFAERIESGLERIEKTLADRDSEPDEAPPNPNDGLAQRVSVDPSDTFAEERLAVLLGQVEMSARRLESLLSDIDSRYKEWLAAQNGHLRATPGSEVLHSVRDEMAALLKGLVSGAPEPSDPEAQLAAIRSLRMRLTNFVDRSGEDDQH